MYISMQHLLSFKRLHTDTASTRYSFNGFGIPQSQITDALIFPLADESEYGSEARVSGQSALQALPEVRGSSSAARALSNAWGGTRYQ